MGGNACVLPIGGQNMGKTPFLTYAAETALAWSLEVLKQQPRYDIQILSIYLRMRWFFDPPQIFDAQLLGNIRTNEITQKKDVHSH